MWPVLTKFEALRTIPILASRSFHQLQHFLFLLHIEGLPRYRTSSRWWSRLSAFYHPIWWLSSRSQLLGSARALLLCSRLWKRLQIPPSESFPIRPAGSFHPHTVPSPFPLRLNRSIFVTGMYISSEILRRQIRPFNKHPWLHFRLQRPPSGGALKFSVFSEVREAWPATLPLFEDFLEASPYWLATIPGLLATEASRARFLKI